MKLEGQCHCGAIRFEAEADAGTSTICHCTDCQVLSGSAFRVNIGVAAEKFRIIAGKPRHYIKTADSGAKRAQGFCTECGTQIYATSAQNPTSYAIRTGTLKQRHQLGRPVKEIWTQSRLPWVAELGPLAAPDSL